METQKIALLQRLRELGVNEFMVQGSHPVTDHWSSVVREACWLSEDFQRERTKHVKDAKRINKIFDIYLKQSRSREIKQRKEVVLGLKKISAKVSREVKRYWSKVERLITFQRSKELEKERKTSMNAHLEALIEQTEKYTNAVQAQLVDKPHRRKKEIGFCGNKGKHFGQSQGMEEEDDDSYEGSGSGTEEDNESTLEAEEELTRLERLQDGKSLNYDEEIELLKKESEMPVEALRALYGYDDLNGREEDREAIWEKFAVTRAEEEEESEGKRENDEEIEEEEDDSYEGSGSGTEEDNESTLEAEEELTRLERLQDGKSLNYDEEIELLKKESEMPVEALRALYGNGREEDREAIWEKFAVTRAEEEEESEGKRENDEEIEEEEDDSYEGSGSGTEEDNESTLEAEEELTRLERLQDGKSLNYDEEIELLKKESEMPVEALRALYGYDDLNGREEDREAIWEKFAVTRAEEEEESEGKRGNDEEIEEEDDSYEGSGSGTEEDNESTLEAEEELTRLERLQDGKSLNYDEEIELLKKESEMPVEALRALYGYDDLNGREEDREASAQQSGRFSPQSNNIGTLKNISFLLSGFLQLRPYQETGVRWLISLHDLSINGILADEMGLGKTIQTITMLAFLASNRGCWGPHLVVAPSSCIINWEYELKRFCPAFKVISYFGSAKQRRILRSGWSKPNAFHICITSYQLAVQDSNIFKRRKWYYLILDEAHNIKNFKSKRWQILLKFNSLRRLMLSGTPLQNNVLELWSLMHFLMPKIFASRREFSYWFNNPLVDSLEMNGVVNPEIIKKLHRIIRPFILRRLKKDVAKQLPAKHEHLILCKMAKRQALLYEEFISKSIVNASLSACNYLGMMNALMQLRKICNHPDLVEPRSVLTPTVFPCLRYPAFSVIWSCLYSSKVGSTSLTVWVDDFSYFSAENDVSGTCEHVKPCSIQFRKIADFQSYQKSSAERRVKFADHLLHLKSILELNRVDLLRFSQLILFNKSQTIPLSYNWKSYLYYNVQLLLIFSFVMEKVVTAPVQVSKPHQLRSEFSCDFRSLPLNSVVEIALEPFRQIRLNQTMFYPPKNLVQYDSGKLQQLERLLCRLRKGHHKCLIFTQMTKMLDILEKFLNLYCYSYVRLDGSTSIEQRQLLMDRFNSDDKIFCFILSTRSGGLGINLVGADTVIFYDTDWNPTVDAQAQDRAHRIGQSREVFIYRLICESTVEQNILLKARQKQKLDSLVITEGEFSAESLFSVQTLQYAFGIATVAVESNTNLEHLMKEFEDVEDQSAMENLKLEMEKDLQEFADEKVGPSGEIVPPSLATPLDGVISVLKPIDKYSFQTFQSHHKYDVLSKQEDFTDIDSENSNNTEHHPAEFATELIVADVRKSCTITPSKYLTERKERNMKRILRALKGECWKLYNIDSTQYWFNEDTGEVTFEIPKVIRIREEHEEALASRFNYLPLEAMKNIFSYLTPFPDRMKASQACARWRGAATAPEWDLYVQAADLESVATSWRSNFRIFSSLLKALVAAQPGDTIVLSKGHHWENQIQINIPLKLMSKDDPSQCVLELSQPMLVNSTKIIASGLTFRTHSCNVAICNLQSKTMFERCVFHPINCSIIANGGLVSLFSCVVEKGKQFLLGEQLTVLIHNSEFLSVELVLHLRNSACFVQDSSFESCRAIYNSKFSLFKFQHCDFARSLDKSFYIESDGNVVEVNSSILVAGINALSVITQKLSR